MLQKFSKTLIKNKSVLCDHGNLCANKNIEVLQQTVKQEFPTALDRIGRNLISKTNFPLHVANVYGELQRVTEQNYIYSITAYYTNLSIIQK